MTSADRSPRDDASTPVKPGAEVVAFPKSVRRAAVDRAFLPAALEIQESPPSPIGRAISLFVVAAFLVGLVASTVAPVDIVASATGRIVPSGRTKVVQPFEAGVVQAIRVADGQTVHKGEVLIELDPGPAEAERTRVAADLDTARLDLARLTALLAAPSIEAADPTAAFVVPGGIDAARVQPTRWLLESQIAEHRAKLAAIDLQIAQRRAEIETTGAAMRKIADAIPMIGERLDIRRQLFGRELGSRLALLDAAQAEAEAKAELAIQTSRRAEAVAARDVAIANRAEVAADWRRSLSVERVEAERKVATLAQDLDKATRRLGYETLVAPVDGVVQQLAVHSIGGVVSPGQVLLSVVPAGDAIEIEADVSNHDIGFVEAGQTAAIKVDTFDFTRYGLLTGTVTSVSQDAVPRQRGTDRPEDRTGGEGVSSEPKTQDLVYPARIAIPERIMRIEGKSMPLRPGMAVTVEIKTGSRTVMTYLLSPLQRYRHEVFRER